MKKHSWAFALLPVVALIFMAAGQIDQNSFSFLFGSAEANSQKMITQGRHTFRFDTFGDEAFWGDTLKLHETINNLPPREALALGLKIDSRALPATVIQAIQNGTVNLNDPAVTLLLVKLRAVLGVVGFFNSEGKLKSVGLTCAVCHSTVDNSVAPSVGRRIDG